ncbi:hypothetical protein BX666DRAFT_1942003 [Dichotomocladium elegans]|nr:hypothetical protein BX666DRAFT_1942003 [Dichotomocladium elegans]
MDYLFQTDINGALEYLEREPGDAIDVFQTSLQPTLDYYQGSPEARMALAQVLFRAWHFRDVHRTDFSVSRYGRGIHTAEYLALVDSNGLFDYMMTNLYLIPVEDAISVLQELLKHDSTEKAGRFLIHYLRIAHALREDFDYMEAIRFLLSNKYSITGDQRLELQRLFKDQLKLCRSSRRTSLENLMAILGMPPCSDVTKKRKRIEVLVSPVQLSIDMKEQWELTKDKSHRNAFILICDHFQKESRAFPSLAATEISGLPRALISQTLFQKLAKKLDDTRSKLNQRKKWCLMALYNQIPGWKSVLTAMVQFTDLWIEEWIHPDVSETFLSLISSENLIIQSYQHLRRLLNVLQLNVIEKRKAEDVCRFFYKLLDRIEDPAKLVALRNFIFTDMIHDHPMTFNLFGSISVVDLKIEITRALNQHVRLENGCTDSHVLRKLLMLSILYPYGVMKEIVSECIMSKDKQRTIIPLLYQMDGLCRLGITNTESGKVTTLFDEFFQNYLSEIRSDGTNINLADVRAFFRSTTQDLKEKSNDIPVLGPYERAAFSANIPINLGTFLRDQLPGLLAIPNDSTSIKLGLEILAAACHVESEQWEKLTDITTLPESILLKAQPIELCFVLTKIQNLRYSNSLDLPPQYAEMALTIQQKLSAAISLTTNYDTTVYSHILVIMKKLEKDFDWRARMLWSDLDYSICYRHDPSCAKITVPSAVKSLVHTLGGSCQIFEGREMQNEDPWAVFFDCCKLSLSFINQVFAVIHIIRRRSETSSTLMLSIGKRILGRRLPSAVLRPNVR